MKQKTLLLLGAVLWAGSLCAADVFTIDKAHSRVGFSVKHMMVSTTRGEFKDYSGEWMVDLKNLTNSSVKFVIQVASIDTQEPKRDEHLRNGDFFDATKYPTITFVSSKVKKTSTGYELWGDLTIKDVTKKVVIPFTLNGPIASPWGTTLIGVEGGLTINRQDYHVSWNKALDTGGVVVGDEVKIDLVLEGSKGK